MARDVHWPVKIRKAAELAGTTETALRFYERMGLITPDRSPAGTRLYHRHHVQRIIAIIALQEAGVHLEDIRAIMDARATAETGHESSQNVAALLQNHLFRIRQRQRALGELADQLEQAMALVRRCRGCRNRPDSKHCPNCPVNLNRHAAPFLNLFWE